MGLRRLATLLLAATTALVLAAALPAAATADAPACPEDARCLTVTVPLDRTGAVPGTLTLPVVVEAGDGPVLLVLGGGPGQAMTADAATAIAVFGAYAPGHRIAVLDQRGTGAGAIRCPALQRAGLSDLTVAPQGAAAACGAHLGVRRHVYATTETVADLDAVRAALGVERIAVAGTSYGSYVAARYARAHPDRVTRLVLDSVVPQENVDPLFAASMREAGRILRRSCQRGDCRGVTRNAVRDLARLVQRLDGRPLARRVAVGDAHERVRLDGPALFDTLVTLTSFQPQLYARFPAAVRDALAGRPRMLLRMAATTRAANRHASAEQLSWGLHTATICADVAFPWGSPATPLHERQAAIDAALERQPVRAHHPFDASTAGSNGLLGRCLRWPPTDVAPPPPPPGPLPRVPILVLAGTLDLSTPLADARREARRSPTAQLAVVPGTGHAVLWRPQACVQELLRRFFADRTLGEPCARLRDPELMAAAPRAAHMVPGGSRRERIATAVRLTLSDAAAFVTAAGGGAVTGLHGGRAQVDDGHLVLRRFSLVRGVPVSGRMELATGRGVMRVGGRLLRARVGVTDAGARLDVRAL